MKRSEVNAVHPSEYIAMKRAKCIANNLETVAFSPCSRCLQEDAPSMLTCYNSSLLSDKYWSGPVRYSNCQESRLQTELFNGPLGIHDILESNAVK